MSDIRSNCPMRHENGNCLPCGGFCTAVNDEICHALHKAYDQGCYDKTLLDLWDKPMIGGSWDE